MNTGERLRQLREQYRLSQNDVAKVLQVTTSLLRAWRENAQSFETGSACRFVSHDNGLSSVPKQFL